MTVIVPFRAPYAADDGEIAARFLAGAALDPAREQAVDRLATRMIEAIRADHAGIGGVESVLREYALTTKEGLALMVLAEALLRVPDAATADRLIEDKLGQGDFAHHEPKSEAVLVNWGAWALGLTARIIQPGETPDGILAGLAKRIGLPAVRTATRQAMRIMGSHFVLGETIEEALKRATSGDARRYRYSFDMLGEGARTARDAERYWQSYAAAIETIGRNAGNDALPNRPGISVKLSALHPRYEALSAARVMDELVPQVVRLAQAARRYDLNFTIDAEEADRLELSLDVIARVAADPSLEGWNGFGLAIQAYQKRALEVIDWVDRLAQTLDRRFMVRLVKGAYWDSEVKRAQERGLVDYPVFTRKAMTDLSYGECVRRLLAARPRLYPQFATHNALTIATIVELAGGTDGYEFQRLHGMGEATYRALLADFPAAACRTYAPVGGHRDLLAYLVRRLLENGANSSFVNVAGDPDTPIANLLKRPAAIIGSADRARHRHLPLPHAIYGAERRNSEGVELGHAASVAALGVSLEPHAGGFHAASLVAGSKAGGMPRRCLSPSNGADIGEVVEADAKVARLAMDAAAAAFPDWRDTSVAVRAQALETSAAALERDRGQFLALLQAEAGKTIDDAIAEVREAVDFLRYYAAEARRSFAPEGELLPGPTGEDNRLKHRGRGVFVCISPWNFPLAIFSGQIAAALAAGNAVVAKPAEQTPLIAHAMVRLMHQAGVPKAVLNLVLGDGGVGAALTGDARVAGVAFTGSTEVARIINRALAAKDGPIVPLIAETGGINVMVVDGTALPEQVADDVVTSAFRSAGQRCSALRVLAVEAHVADKIVEMIAGAARELKIGDPRDVSVQVGPVIDAEARDRLNAHCRLLREKGLRSLLNRTDLPAAGTYVVPEIFEVPSLSEVKEEVFGPILHVVRWRSETGADRQDRGLKRLMAEVIASGFGLTGGLHTRIDETIRAVERMTPAGNFYVNRNMIGAVVGTQPFGGSGLSGTGPKAGGPNYLKRFANEVVVSINTSAAGGNASLVAMAEE